MLSLRPFEDWTWSGVKKDWRGEDPEYSDTVEQ